MKRKSVRVRIPLNWKRRNWSAIASLSALLCALRHTKQRKVMLIAGRILTGGGSQTRGKMRLESSALELRTEGGTIEAGRREKWSSGKQFGIEMGEGAAGDSFGKSVYIDNFTDNCARRNRILGSTGLGKSLR